MQVWLTRDELLLLKDALTILREEIPHRGEYSPAFRDKLLKVSDRLLEKVERAVADVAEVRLSPANDHR